jgi:hypothetical protein
METMVLFIATPAADGGAVVGTFVETVELAGVEAGCQCCVCVFNELFRAFCS